MTRDGQRHPRLWTAITFKPSVRGTGNFGWALSPTGDRIVYQEQVDGDAEISVLQLPAGPSTRLTFHDGRDLMPKWSPDGERVTFASAREPEDESRTYSLWSRAADGSGVAERVVDGSLLGELGVTRHDWFARWRMDRARPGRRGEREP